MTADQQSLGRARASELKLRLDRHNATYSWGYPYSAGGGGGEREWYTADDVHRILGAGFEVTGVWPENGQFEMHREKYQWATHKCLAIGITPPAKPTREEQAIALLSELVAHGESFDLRDRVKALLAKDAV